MADIQSTDQSPHSVLGKLLEVDSDLAAQHAELIAQLEVIQEKRKGLETVIEMFSAGHTPKSPSAAPKLEKPRDSKPSKDVTPPSEQALTKQLSSSEAAISQNGRATTGKKTSGKAKSSTKPKASAKTKTSRKSNGWQYYVRGEFGKTSLPDIVAQILQQRPNEVYDTPSLVTAVFSDDLPDDIYTKARDRISNILSAGVRDKKWYRGKIGSYSLSKTAAESNK